MIVMTIMVFGRQCRNVRVHQRRSKKKWGDLAIHTPSALRSSQNTLLASYSLSFFLSLLASHDDYLATGPSLTLFSVIMASWLTCMCARSLAVCARRVDSWLYDCVFIRARVFACNDIRCVAAFRMEFLMAQAHGMNCWRLLVGRACVLGAAGVVLFGFG